VRRARSVDRAVLYKRLGATAFLAGIIGLGLGNEVLGVSSTALGVLLTMTAHEVNESRLERLLQQYLMPGELGKLAVQASPLFAAVSELTTSLAAQHDFGRLPIMDAYAETLLLAEIQRPVCDPTGFRTHWFVATTTESWVSRPYDCGRQERLDPAEVLGTRIVMSSRANIAAVRFRAPGLRVSFPVPAIVAESAELAPQAWQFESVKFLTGGSDHPLTYSVQLRVAGRAVGQGIIALEEVWSRADGDERARLLSTLFPGANLFSDVWDILLSETFEVHRPTVSPTELHITFPGSGDMDWYFEGTSNLVLPMKFIRELDEAVLWDQHSFVETFDRVTRVRELKFLSKEPCIEFSPLLRPQLWRQVLTSSGRAGFSLEGDGWSVRGGDRFWFPGDAVCFSWTEPTSSSRFDDRIEEG
jgi:hypothetical protein